MMGTHIISQMGKNLKLRHLRKASSCGPEVARGQACAVCEESADGMYFGAVVCLPCKSFFIRCTKDGEPKFTCIAAGTCDISRTNRLRCQYCRFQRCLDAGMCRKEKPESVEPAEGQELCRVCSDIANGIHFGTVTCEGCKKFFRRALRESATYSCKQNGVCTLNPRNRNSCRYCRFQKCLEEGMSRKAIRMGRPRKSTERDATPEKLEYEGGLVSPTSSGSPCQLPLPPSPTSSFSLQEHASAFREQIREVDDLLLSSARLLGPGGGAGLYEDGIGGELCPVLDSSTGDSNLSAEDLTIHANPIPVSSDTGHRYPGFRHQSPVSTSPDDLHVHRVPSPETVSHPIIDVEGNLTDILASLEEYQGLHEAEKTVHTATEEQAFKQELVPASLAALYPYNSESSSDTSFALVHPSYSHSSLQELGSSHYTFQDTQGWDCRLTEGLYSQWSGLRYEARITATFPYGGCKGSLDNVLPHVW